MLLRSNFSSFSQYFFCLLLDFHVSAGTRFSLRDKRLFEISEFEITRVNRVFFVLCYALLLLAAGLFSVLSCFSECRIFVIVFFSNYDDLVGKEVVVWSALHWFVACALITKTRLYNFDLLKLHFYILKLGFTVVYSCFLILLTT